jgi:hypothetical protein
MASVILEKSMYFAFYSAIKDWIKPQSLLSNVFTGYSAELCRVPFVFPIEVQRPTLPPSPLAPQPSPSPPLPRPFTPLCLQTISARNTH